MQIYANGYANKAGWDAQGTAYLSATAQVGRMRSLSPAAVFQANHTFRLTGFSPATWQSPETWSSWQD